MDTLLKLLWKAIASVLEFFRPKHPFSWQTLFLIGLFSWSMALLSVENFDIGPGSLLPTDTVPSQAENDSSIPPATWALFTMGWIFFTIAVGWLLANEKVKLPFLNITIQPAVWVTSALTSIFLFRVWDPAMRPLALMSWPIIFALYSALPKFLVVRDTQFAVPRPVARQQIVITSLICLVISCWIRFHFVLQDWITDDYPVMQAGDFRFSGFVVQMGEPLPVMSAAETALVEELAPRAIPDIRRWLVRVRNNPENLETLNTRFQGRLEAEGLPPSWQLSIVPVRIYDPRFKLHVAPLAMMAPREDASLSRERVTSGTPPRSGIDADEETDEFDSPRRLGDAETADSEPSTRRTPEPVSERFVLEKTCTIEATDGLDDRLNGGRSESSSESDSASSGDISSHESSPDDERGMDANDGDDSAEIQSADLQQYPSRVNCLLRTQLVATHQ